MTEPVQLTPVLWEINRAENDVRYLWVIRQWWFEHTLILIVCAINTFARDDGTSWGDYACYIGSPPFRPKSRASYYDVNYVAENGAKLTEQEASGFPSISPAPNGIEVVYRS